MKKYLDIKGRNVVDCQGGLLGAVEDGIFDYKSCRICSFMIKNGGVLSKSSIIPSGCIIKSGDTMLCNGTSFPCKRKKAVMRRITTLNKLLEKQIISDDGENEGQLADIIIDKNSWCIMALICSGGIVEDFLSGRKLILVDKDTSLTNDKIVVSKDNIKPLKGSSINSYFEHQVNRR